jgi:hypothetical protein
MPSVKRRASKILKEYGAAQSELIGKAVVLTDGKAGTVENVWLDELHGLRISIKVMMEDGRSQLSSSRRTRRSHRMRDCPSAADVVSELESMLAATLATQLLRSERGQGRDCQSHQPQLPLSRCRSTAAGL